MALTKQADDAARSRCRPCPDLGQRAFSASSPDQLWVADITYLPTIDEGVLYLAVILDVFSRRVVGWSMQHHMRTELVLAALEMAVSKRRPEAGLIHHSDHGSQYTSVRYGERCRAAGIRSSMGTIGDCYDNALMESFFATLECELLGPQRFRTHDTKFAWILVVCQNVWPHEFRTGNQLSTSIETVSVSRIWSGSGPA